ncbi:MAG: toprim domain-containing protein, partial [Pyrinomonadaceae bacterium]
GRLIFPVMDIQGKPIAFGGRTLRNEDAKYINSPETAAYVKGRNLFGLNHTRDEIRKQGFAILVEGFLDLIVPYQFGVRNLVASLGTALTADQVKLLGRFARKVVVNYDGDPAGVQAAKKALEILLAEDLEVKILVLPDKADPDEFIRKSGVSEYQRQRGEARPHIQFVIDHAVRDRKLSNPADKEAAIDEVLPYIRAVRSRLQKREYFDIAMDALRVSDAALKRELWHSIRTTSNTTTNVRPRSIKSTAVKPTVAEQRLLELLLADEQIRHRVLSKLEADDYADLPTARIFLALVEGERQGAAIDFQFLTEKTEGDPISELLPSLLMAEVESAEAEELEVRQLAAQKCLDALRLMKVDRRITEIASEMAAAERNGEVERRDRLSIEHLELARRRSSLLPRADAMQIGH